MPDAVERYEYAGSELELFRLAGNWKRYIASRMRPFVTGDVLEVGAGIGSNISYLHSDSTTRWVSLEPDLQLCQQYRRGQSRGSIPASCELVQGTLDALPADAIFDSILYIDVLEHIEDDRGEFDRAYDRLKPDGYLLVLSPAHNVLFSPFDKAIGHFRRYNKRMYRELSDLQPLVLEYLDSVGILISAANKLLLRRTSPSTKQIKLWDRLVVRLSSVLDPLTFRMVGKSILGVWTK